jgi:hypothetical protein
MAVRRRCAAASLALTAVAFVLLAPATSFADSVASTQPATSITITGAALNGIANPSNPDSSWAFQYGTTTSYGRTTPVHHIGVGSQSVSETVNNLAPATTYHFRLVVVEGSYPGTGHTGEDLVFTTKTKGGGSLGGVSLRSKKLRIKHGRLTVPLKCSGGPCSGKVSVSVSAAKGKSLRCMSGGFNVSSPKKFKVRKKVKSGCLALVKKAKHRRHKGTLILTVSTAQGQLKRSVVLFIK